VKRRTCQTLTFILAQKKKEKKTYQAKLP
jgi:hypothetical protein